MARQRYDKDDDRRSDLFGDWRAAEKKGKKSGLFDPNNTVIDPADLLVPAPMAADAVSIAARVDKDEWRIIEELLAEQKLFRTKGDFFRAAVHWFLKERIIPLRPRFASDMQRMEAQLRVLHQLESMNNVEKVLRPSLRMIRRIDEAGDIDGAAEMVLKVEESLKEAFPNPVLYNYGLKKLWSERGMRTVLAAAEDLKAKRAAEGDE